MAAKVLDSRLIDYTPDDGSYERFMDCMGDSFGEAPGSWGFQYIRRGFGYCPKTMQRSVSIGLPKDADLTAAKAEVEEVIRYIRPIDGRRPLRIREYTQGDFGVYDLAKIESSGEWAVVHWYYGSDMIKATGTLEDMLALVRTQYHLLEED